MVTNINSVQKMMLDIQQNISQFVIGQEKVIKFTIISLFSRGHILLEGVPGLGKTLVAHSLAKSIGGEFKRIQFTPDLMPSDIVGTSIFNPQKNQFQIKKGPVFCSILLADEINRSPAKTQSALLQAMQERTVNIDGNNLALDQNFLCIATQNPIEMEGTYPLPEAQLDRFLMKVVIDYPDNVSEENMLNKFLEQKIKQDFSQIEITSKLSPADMEKIQKLLQTVRVDQSILKYIVQLVDATRKYPGIEVGASPRASVSLLLASRTLAVYNGRDYVIPDDVKELAFPILRHRIIIEPELEIEGTDEEIIVQDIINSIEVPR